MMKRHGRFVLFSTYVSLVIDFRSRVFGRLAVSRELAGSLRTVTHVGVATCVQVKCWQLKVLTRVLDVKWKLVTSKVEGSFHDSTTLCPRIALQQFSNIDVVWGPCHKVWPVAVAPVFSQALEWLISVSLFFPFRPPRPSRQSCRRTRW